MQDVLNQELSDNLVEQQDPQSMSLVHGHWRKKEKILPLLTGEEENESQQLDLKPLPVKLKYAFLEENRQCPVIISSLLSTPQEDNLLQILKSNK